jgi:transposase-like protein
MPRAAVRDAIYYRRRYTPEVIELCVRWYVTYRLSYRDISAMMAERDISVSHTTILRWVQRYVPEFERRWARFARPINSSWRVDETSVPVQGRWNYLYRAVDRNGKSVHSLLSQDRTIDSAQEFFRQAVGVAGSWPEKVNLDGNIASRRALQLLGNEDPRWQSITIRTRRYLNNIIEQDHRAIKRKCASMLSLKSFRTAAVTFSGVELAHRIHKRQFGIAYQRDCRPLSLKALSDQALSGASLPNTEEKPPPPLTQQNSKSRSRPRGALRRGRRIFLRHARRVPFGGGLHLLVSPTGGRSWHYRYRFDGRDNLLSIGRYPEVPIENAWARHQAARQLLALGVNPADRKKALRQISAVRI